MFLWTVLKVALGSLWANKLRSFLSILGIIIGVASVISMLAISAGVRESIMKNLTALGTNNIWISPRGFRRGGVRTASRQNLTLADARAVLTEIPNVKAVSPGVRGSAQVKYFNENTNATVTGVTASFKDMRTLEFDKGRNFTPLETERTARVAILGGEVAKTLFGENDPVGKDIRVGSINFHVIGVFKVKGNQGFNIDDWVFIPYTTAMKRLLGKDSLDVIDIQASDQADVNKVKDAVIALMKKRHGIGPDDEDDFHVGAMADLLERASEATGTFTILMGCIGSISLLVGGIGIMNIMLVTVTERTREIGVRKAIGARSWDILSQFLIESILISALGGILGIGLGYGVSSLIAHFTELIPVIQIHTVLLSFVVSGMVGVVFGFLPARRAARLDPIEALRYE